MWDEIWWLIREMPNDVFTKVEAIVTLREMIMAQRPEDHERLFAVLNRRLRNLDSLGEDRIWDALTVPEDEDRRDEYPELDADFDGDSIDSDSDLLDDDEQIE